MKRSSTFECSASLRWILAFSLLCGCDALGSVVVEAGDFAGAKADAHCDRRFVTDGGQPVAFCQEVTATVAASEFADDCRSKHRATAAPGLCPRTNVLAGCKLLKRNQDESNVWDWYYDVSDLTADAGADGGPQFENPPRSAADVAALCKDPGRYEEGAEFVQP